MSLLPSTFGLYGYGGYGMSGPAAAIALPESTPVSIDEPVKVAEPVDRSLMMPLGGYGSFPGFDAAPPSSLWLFWQMRRYSAIILALATVIAPILAGTQTVEVADGLGEDDAANDRKGKAQKYLMPLLTDCYGPAFECLNFGHWLSEVVWDRLDGMTVPTKIVSLLPGEAILYRDKFRQFTGYRVGEEYRDARYAFLAVNDPHIDPIFGYSRNEGCREEWWRARQSNKNADQLEKKASGIQMLISIMQGMTFTDSSGKPMGNQAVGQMYMNAAVQGQCIVAPLTPFERSAIERNPELGKMPAVKAEAFDWGNIAPALMAHLSRLDRLDRDMIRAWHRPEREATEGHHGTKAEASAHGAIGTTDSEQVASLILRQFNRQVVDRWLVTNFGPDAKGTVFVKQAPLSDPQQQFLQQAWQAVASDTATGPELMASIDLRGLSGRVEMPMVSEDEADAKLADLQQQAADKQAAQNKALSQANGQPTNGQPPANGNGVPVKIAASANGHGSTAFRMALLHSLAQKHEGELALSDDSDGHWVTMEGEHVFIGGGGTITKGPSHLVGKKPSDIGSKHLENNDGSLPASEAQRHWDNGTVPEGWHVHGRASSQELRGDNVIQATRDVDTASQYAGKNGSVHYLKPKDSASVLDASDGGKLDKITAALKQDYEDGKLSPALDETIKSAGGPENFKDGFNPRKIVTSAENYDDRDLSAWLYDRFGYDAVETNDGMVVLNKAEMHSTKVPVYSRSRSMN